jgi:hypothetical protein
VRGRRLLQAPAPIGTGQTLPPHQELSIRVLVKDQGAWRITAFHNTILQK